MTARIMIAALVAVIVAIGLAPSGRAWDFDDDFWLGLWCDQDGRVAVINHGVDPDAILAHLRGQLPEARARVPANVRLGPPQHNGACVVAGAGEVRVTTRVYKGRGLSRVGYDIVHAAWIGQRRFVYGTQPQGIRAYVVTASLVFECEAARMWDSETRDWKRDPVRCNPLGPPARVGYFDGSMFPPNGEGRPREGFLLRYGRQPGACDPFIPEPERDYYFDVAQGRLVLRLFDGLTRDVATGIDWRKLGEEGSGVSGTVVDFLNRGQADPVFRVANTWYGPRDAFFSEVFHIVVRRPAGDFDAIARDVVEAARSAQPSRSETFGHSIRSDVLATVAARYEIVVVDGNGLIDGLAEEAIGAYRRDGVTYTLLEPGLRWSRQRLGLALARIEPGGRQTPLCLYDWSVTPPDAPF